MSPRINAQPSKQVIQTIANDELNVCQFLDSTEFLARLYQIAKQKLGGYSYLRFADDLGFGQTNVLRLIIIGSRTLSAKAGRRIADGLGFHGNLRRYWTTLVEYQAATKSEERERLLRLLTSYKAQSLPDDVGQQQMEYFSEWYHPIIREAIAMAPSGMSVEGIQDILDFPLRLEQIKKSVELLERLGYIHRIDDSELFVRRSGSVSTAREVENLSVVRFHQKMIESAKESITRTHESRRSVSGVTICLPEHCVDEVKEKIEKLMEEVLAMELQDHTDSSTAVFQLNVQFFPFTKRKE